MKVFVDSSINYEGKALQKMRELVGRPLPVFSLSYLIRNAADVDVDWRKKVQVVR